LKSIPHFKPDSFSNIGTQSSSVAPGYTVDSYTTIEPGLKDTQEVRTRGTFSLHGEKKEIEVNGKAVFEDENTLYIEANWELNLHDYNIEVPKFLFLKVNEVQVIEISATLKPK
jgi:polyisoprenoid-binding protein YceI